MDDEPTTDLTEAATLGGGCFWCLDAVFRRIEGVRSVRSGYAGGDRPDPTYREVCTGTTGHAEVVQVSFDPEVLSYAELLRIFFVLHDPTTPDRQGADVGPQYRSIVLTHSEGQERVAREILSEVSESGIWGAPPVTEIRPLERLYEAEPEHQGYYDRNPGAGYCRIVIEPKVAKVRRTFAHRFRE